MLKSIRWTLQLWHAGLLALVVAAFGTFSYYQIRTSQYQRIDAELERSLRLLANGVWYPPRGPRPGEGPRMGDGLRPGEIPRMNDGPPQQPPWDQPPGPPPRNPNDDPRRGRGGQNFGGFDGFDGPGGGGPGGGRGGRGGGGYWPPGTSMPADVTVPPTLAQRFGDGDAGSLYYVIWDYDRNSTKTSRPTEDIPDPNTPFPAALPGIRPAIEPTFRQRDDLREVFMFGPAGTRLLVGKSILTDQADLRRYAWLMAGAGATLLAVGLAGGFLLSWRAVRPIYAITAAAQNISASNLSQRIDVAHTQSELGTLATVLNDTFARLDSAFQQQMRFTADASHELRTPVSVIHTHAQLALSRPRTPDEYRHTLEICLRATHRMKELVDSLLVLAKADAGKLSLDPKPLDLAALAEECLQMVTPMAAARGITLLPTLHSAPLTADAQRLAQVLINLLTNAIRYNKENGTIRVDVDTKDNRVLLRVTDTGIGIPADSLPHLFERFYRVDTARSRDDGGNGLGLAICKSIVDAHHGTIQIISQPDLGTTVSVSLPQK